MKKVYCLSLLLYYINIVNYNIFLHFFIIIIIISIMVMAFFIIFLFLLDNNRDRGVVIVGRVLKKEDRR